jgi:hypothetical protein
VTTPSAFSRFTTGSCGVSFSRDGSLLAVAYGNNIALWDHRNTRLLRSLSHCNQLEAGRDIERIIFIDSQFLSDVILVYSTCGVSLLSPFGNLGPVNIGWEWVLPHAASKGHQITYVEHLPVCHQVVVSVYDSSSEASELYFLCSVTGELLRSKKGILTEKQVPGRVEVIAAAERQSDAKSAWGTLTGDGNDSNTIHFYMVNDAGQMFSFRNDDLPVLPTPAITRKRARVSNLLAPSSTDKPSHSGIVVQCAEFEVTKPKVSLRNFGVVDGQEPSTSTEIPVLHDAFLRSFISRNITR